jgi:hypothetical protein
MNVIETLCEGPVPVYLVRAAGSRPPKWLEDWYYILTRAELVSARAGAQRLGISDNQ